MTIEEEIRKRLRAMGLDQESVEPCMAYVKADPLMKGMAGSWIHETAVYPDATKKSFWLAAKSSALDYLEQKYYVEARKSPVTLEDDGEEERIVKTHG